MGGGVGRGIGTIWEALVKYQCLGLTPEGSDCEPVVLKLCHALDSPEGIFMPLMPKLHPKLIKSGPERYIEERRLAELSD